MPATANTALTLTQVLTQQHILRLLGTRISDLSPRGDLGLGPDPGGPVGFALVRAVAQGGHWSLLPAPIVLSVFGDGQPPGAEDALARPDERIWTAGSQDAALQLRIVPAPLGSLLQMALG
ncbi:MAG TPA: hypothetical protein PK306_08495 [Aquabacterium sp.]|nr:hypothetical protein [Aquabacterium sp.]HQC95732.1 hypothetical protein [Aquabacterium sp.]